MRHIPIVLHTTGRSIDAHGGIVGIVAGNAGDRIYYGYDATPDTVLDLNYEEGYAHEPLTAVECVELADRMIDTWQAYRTRALAALRKEAPGHE